MRVFKAELIESLVDHFALKCFRDEADGDYIAARMAFGAKLYTSAQWSTQQALEKYLKCILLLNRIPARNIRHNICGALNLIKTSGKLKLDLETSTEELIQHIGAFGEYRYFEVPTTAYGIHLLSLDRAVWELRRFCTKNDELSSIRLTKGCAAPLIRLDDGYLEKILDNKAHPARARLVNQNAFFAGKRRKLIKIERWVRAANPPLILYPEMLDEVIKFIYLPKPIVDAYRNLASVRSEQVSYSGS